MKLRYLTDDDLIAVTDDMCGDFSFLVAGWDVANRHPGEARREIRVRRQLREVEAEMRKRGLRPTRPGLYTWLP